MRRHEPVAWRGRACYTRRVGKILKDRLRQSRFESPAHEAMLNLMVASAHVRQLIDEICAAHGITRAQYNALRILRGAHPDGYPRGEIAARLIERAPDVTRLIDRLERQRLVERTVSAADRRLSITRITRAGLDLLKRVDPGVRSVQRRFGQRITVRDMRELSRICEQLYAADQH
jgi:DNA-binding MarR family transcriptional regulator